MEDNNLKDVQIILEENDSSEFDINCKDTIGRGALLIALESENVQMVELLIKSDIRVGDALLYAIRKQMVPAVKLLLYQMKKQNKFCMVGKLYRL